MSEEELATIDTPIAKLRELIQKSSLSGGAGDPYFGDVYVHLNDDEVLNTLVGAPGGVLTAYCTFEEPALDAAELGTDEDARAVINVARLQSFLDFVSDGGDVRLALRGTPGDIAGAMEIYGALNTRVMLKAGEKSLESVPMGVPERFDDEERFHSVDEEKGALPVTIETTAEDVQRIIDVVDYDPNTTYYPIAVEDGDLHLDIGRDSGRDAVWGALADAEVDAPDDFKNQYGEGFKEVFDNLSGAVTLQTAPGDAPLVIVQEVVEGVTARYIIGPVVQ